MPTIAKQGKRFAVIAVEARSSQTGLAAAKLKVVFSPEELAELKDGGYVSFDDILAAEIANRAGETAIFHVSFTAPKTKTRELSKSGGKALVDQGRWWLHQEVSLSRASLSHPPCQRFL